MDLSKIKAPTKEFELEIEGIGETGFFMSLIYESSPEIQKLQKQYEAKLMEEGKKGRKGDLSKITEWFKKEKSLAHVVGWRFSEGASINGEQPAFTREKLSEIINAGDDLSYFVRDFVFGKINEASNFLEKSA